MNKKQREGDQSVLNENVEKKWYQESSGVILLLLLFFPVGLYLMWKYTKWSIKAKWIITGVLVLLTFIVGTPDMELVEPENSENETSQEVIQKDEKQVNNQDLRLVKKAGTKLENAIGRYSKLYQDLKNALPDNQPPKGDIYERIADINKPGTVDYKWAQFKQEASMGALIYGTNAIDTDLRGKMSDKKGNEYTEVSSKIDEIEFVLMDLETVCTDWLISNKTDIEKSNAEKVVDSAINEARKALNNFRG